MIFSSRYEIDVPKVDLLTYLFGTHYSEPTWLTMLTWKKETPCNPTTPIYVAADNPSRKFNKDEVQTLIKKLAAGLRKVLNIRDDDVVLMFGENSCWERFVLEESSPEPTQGIPVLLNTSGAKCIFTDRQRLETAKEAAKTVGLAPEAIVLVASDGQGTNEDIRSLQSLLTHGTHSWTTISDVKVLADRPAVLNFSSGTTGLPKACAVTHQNLVANSEQTLHLDRMARKRLSDPSFAANDVHCAYLPIYHAMGLLTYCVVNVKRGCTTAIMPRFDLKLLLNSIQLFKVTYLLLVPPVVAMLAKNPLVSEYDMSTVKFLICGAAPLQRDLELQLEAIFSKSGAKSRQGWGMSEATMAVTLFGPDEFDPSHESVGYIVPNMQVKVINEEGEAVGYDEEGEAIIRGPNVFKGYYKNPTATKDAFTEDGWLKTGDIVKIGKNGLVSIADRKKELIKVKGFQVAPSELEGHLLQHEGVQDCAVIRVMRDGQEHPQAHIVRKDSGVTADSICAFMAERLSAHKQITGGVVFTDVIPKSPSGKILRRMLSDVAKKPSSRL
ncbi:4-coumarate-- ligase [Fusarium albosuccineum]|uniref:4-coumarate-- ligase n=1 Tax=Fusarium albosuccineum TaxID=1237068 RepID=A0A8H4L6Q5_9HYPO|nr:4-coumarate-- ligase [Fusarium albosuccineum]